MTAPAFDFTADALDPTLYVRGVAHDTFEWLRVQRPRALGRTQPTLGGVQVRGHLGDRTPARRVLQRPGHPAEGRRRRRPLDRLDGRSRARPPTPAREPGLHAVAHQRDVRTHPGRRPRADRPSCGAWRVRLRRGHRQAAALDRHRRTARAPDRGSRSPGRVVRHDDERRGCRTRRRPEARRSRRSVGRVRDVPRRPGRGTARGTEGRSRFDPARLRGFGRVALPRGRGAGAHGQRSAADERSHGRRAVDVLRVAARRRQRNDTQRAFGRHRSTVTSSPNSKRASSPTPASSRARPRRSCATCRR